MTRRRQPVSSTSRPIPPEDRDRPPITRRPRASLRAAVGGHSSRLYVAAAKYRQTTQACSLPRRLPEAGTRERNDRRSSSIIFGVPVPCATSPSRLAVAAYAAQPARRYPGEVDEVPAANRPRGCRSTALRLGVKLQLEPRADPLPALHALLDLPLRLDTAGGFRALDHVRRVQDLGQAQSADAILRSHDRAPASVASRLRRLRAEAADCRAASVRRSAPLYGQAVPMRLGRLADADIAGDIVDRLSADEALGGKLRRGRYAADAARPPRSARCSSRTGSGTIRAGRHRHAAELGGRRSTRDAARARAGVRGALAALLGGRAARACAAVVEGRGAKLRTNVLARRRRRQDVGQPTRYVASRSRARSTPSTARPRSSIRCSQLWIERVASGAFAGGQE